jgi:hypothetical protein
MTIFPLFFFLVSKVKNKKFLLPGSKGKGGANTARGARQHQLQQHMQSDHDSLRDKALLDMMQREAGKPAASATASASSLRVD